MKIGWVYLIAVIEAIAMGGSMVATKFGLDILSPTQLNAARWSVALVVAVILRILGIIKVDFKGKKIRYVLAIGMILPCLYFTLETKAISLISAAYASILLSLIPIVVVFMSIFAFKTKVDFITWISFFVAAAGVLMTIDYAGGIKGSFTGTIIMLGAVIVGALFGIVSPWAIKNNFTNTEITYVMCIMGGIWFNIIVAINGDFLGMYGRIVQGGSSLFGVLYLGIICSVLCYIMYNYALNYIETHKLTILVVNICTIVGVFLGIILRGDHIRVLTILGLTLILVGILGVNIPRKKIKDIAKW